jgi:RNA polymerase sigma-70 factor, ECF subfamily
MIGGIREHAEKEGAPPPILRGSAFCLEWNAMNVEVSDADLARRIAEGDREAEADMCRRMGPRIRLYGLRHLRSSSAADDLVQQVLLKVLEALRAARLREPDKVAQFVLGTCRMCVLDLRRSSRRQEELLAIFGSDLVPDALPMPGLDDRQLARCVQALKERERSVVVMTFYDDQTAAETAEFLGTSEANVRVIRHRAIKQLRACMEATA